METRLRAERERTRLRKSRSSDPTAPGTPRYSLLRRRGPWKDALRRRLLAAADLAAVLLAAAAAGIVEEDRIATAVWIAALVPLWILIAKGRGLYDGDHVRIRHQTIDEASGLFHWVTMSVALTALFLALLPGQLLSAEGAIAMWCAGFAGAFVLRALARAAWRAIVPPEEGLIVGTGQLADALARKLTLESGHHLSLAKQVSLVDDGDSAANGRPGHVAPDELESLIREQRIERVIVALEDLDEETLADVTSACRSLGVKLSVAPPLRAMLGTAVELNHVAELPLIEFRTWDPSRSTMLFKRAMDVIGASIGLVLAGPFIVLIAAVVKLDSRGPAFFRQLRAGRNGAPFRMLKFRTMVPDAEKRVGEVVAVDDLEEPVFKLRSDPRVTRVGRFLRRTSLDELPQLVNVLRGEMSLVGPRPEETWLVERYDEAERFRLEMRPGMTGPMQVHGRGELTFQERMAVEREYVENYSLRKDIQILMRTVSTAVRGRGAF